SQVLDPQGLVEHLRTDVVSVLEVVPSLLRALIEEVEVRPVALTELRWVISTGEALPAELCRRWLACYPKVGLANTYGPSECSDNVSQHVITRAPRAGETRVPIGRALANQQLYVLDARLQPQPVGVWGEIYVGGMGVGRGYLGDGQRTAQVFVPDPWSREPGGRLYRTGDVGRYRANGVLEFGGRRDQQVKMRGYRIELEEIEQVIGRRAGVRECVVTLHDGQLVGYVVLDKEAPEELELLLDDARHLLPEYMVPTSVVILEKMPLTASGKIDRKALPAPQASGLTAGYVGPRNELEEQVIAIWCELLTLEQIGVYDNFFAIGGHSLLIARVLARVRDTFQVVLPIRTMFKHPTIAELAEIIRSKQEKASEDMQSGGNEPRRQALVPIERAAYRQKRSDVMTV
ncbi:MAG TPA: AMP-binding protein, partial [Ktedonobacteraceae bacterium]|nr:AMP-binding protein [Ktedonobacteraceae bacterium]